MRRLCLFILTAAFLAPAGAIAGGRAAGDGSAAVTGASGTIWFQGSRGLIFGHIDQGTLMIIAYKPDNPTDVVSVTGAKAKVSRAATVYSGSDIRFLLPSGKYTIELIGTGMDASAIGTGIVGAQGFGTADDGSFAVNGGKPVPISTTSASQSFGGK